MIKDQGWRNEVAVGHRGQRRVGGVMAGAQMTKAGTIQLRG